MSSNSEGGIPEGSEMLLMAIVMGIGALALVFVLFIVAKSPSTPLIPT